MSEPVIVADRLAKTFQTAEAVRGISFAVEEGSVFGLVGTNGAGKSTTIRMLLGLSTPTSGSARVFGEDSLSLSRETRMRIGYLSENPIDDHGLPLADLLKYVSAFFDEWDWDRTRELVQRLSVPLDQPLYEMSQGTRRRAELMLTLAQDPDLLVLDDPTIGLDATIRRDFLWGALETARDQGKTVLFTSHVLHDIERAVDTVGIMHEGVMRVVAPLDELQARTKRLVIERERDDVEVPAVRGELERRASGRDLIVTVDSYDEQLERELAQFGVVQVENLDLEEIFCATVGQPSEVAS